MYAAAESSGHSPQASQLYGASAISLGLGLLTSYLIHESVPVDRQPTQNLPELYFGDLPPSPFIMSELNFKKKAAK